MAIMVVVSLHTNGYYVMHMCGGTADLYTLIAEWLLTYMLWVHRNDTRCYQFSFSSFLIT